MLLCSSAEAAGRSLELSLRPCHRKEAKMGIKSQTSAARSRLMVTISLAGSVGRRRWWPSRIAFPGRSFPVALHYLPLANSFFKGCRRTSCTSGTNAYTSCGEAPGIPCCSAHPCGDAAG